MGLRGMGNGMFHHHHALIGESWGNEGMFHLVITIIDPSSPLHCFHCSSRSNDRPNSRHTAENRATEIMGCCHTLPQACQVIHKLLQAYICDCYTAMHARLP